MIRRALILAAAVALAGCVGGSKPATVVQTGRVVSLSDSALAAHTLDTVDLGHVRPGEEVVHRFTLRNDSPSPVVILAAETACGCLDAEFPPQPIMPGGSAGVSLYFHSGGLSGYQYKPLALRTSLGPARYRIVVIADVY